VDTLVAGGVRKGRAQRAVKLLSRSQWNDAYGTHSGPS
jgi:hypothetical protein